MNVVKIVMLVDKLFHIVKDLVPRMEKIEKRHMEEDKKELGIPTTTRPLLPPSSPRIS